MAGSPYAYNAADTVWPDLAEMDAREWDYILLKAFVGYGVSTGCAVTQHSGGSTMSVDVAAGSAYIGFSGVTVNAATLTIATADADPRFDLVQVNSSGTLSVKKGTALANSPLMPVPDSNTTVLGLVYVPGGATAITQNLIRGVGQPLGQHGANFHTGNIVPANTYLELTEIAPPTAATNVSRIYRDPTLNALMAHSDGRSPAPLEGIEALGAGKLTSTGASISLSIPARDLLVIRINAVFGSSGKFPALQFNGDTSGNYAYSMKTVAFSGTTISDANASGANDMIVGYDAGTDMQTIECLIGNYATRIKSVRVDCGGVTTSPAVVFGGGGWGNTSDQITSVKLLEDGGASFLAGTSLAIFGFNAGVNYD